MPLPRWKSLSPDKRATILRAATAEFAVHGLAEASYNRIIAAAGVSKGAMYYAFSDKEDLFVEVVRHALAPAAPLARLPEAVPDAASFWSLMEARADEAARTFATDTTTAALARGLYENVGAGVPAGGPLHTLLQDVSAWMDRAIALGQGCGAVRDDLPRDLLARVALGALVAMDRWFVEHIPRDLAAPGPDAAVHGDDPAALAAMGARAFGLLRNLLEPRAR